MIDVPVMQVVQFPGRWSRRAENCGFHSCSSCLVVYMPVVVHDKFGVFSGPCTQVHGQGCPPPLGRGRGGGDAGSLLLDVLPPNWLQVGTSLDRHAVSWIVRTTTTRFEQVALPLFLCILLLVEPTREAHGCSRRS